MEQIDLDALRREYDRLGPEIEQGQAVLNDKISRRNRIGEFLHLAAALFDPPVSAPRTLQAVPDPPPPQEVDVLPPVGTWPTTVAAGIREVMEQGGVWSPKQIADEMRRRGWYSMSPSPEGIVASQLSKMLRVPHSEVRKHGFARYELIQMTDDTTTVNGSGIPIDSGDGTPP